MIRGGRAKLTATTRMEPANISHRDAVLARCSPGDSATPFATRTALYCASAEDAMIRKKPVTMKPKIAMIWRAPSVRRAGDS